MSIEMNLEISDGLEGWKTIKLLLDELGMTEVENYEGLGLRAVLGHGELVVGAVWGNAPRNGEIRAEGNHGCSFSVMGNLSFRINGVQYDEAVATIKRFLVSLSERSNMLFVLSFQYEGVYATRDRERGFEWFWDSPR